MKRKIMSMDSNGMRIKTNIHSIKTRMILLLGTIILVVSAGMGLISYYISSSALIGNLNQMLPEIAKESALLIERNIASNFDLIDGIIYNLKDSSLTEDQKFSKLKTQETRGKYLLLGIADTHGKFVTSNKKEINILELSSYQKALTGESTVNEPMQDPFGITGISENTLVVIYTTPIKVGGKVESVLVAVKSGNEFSALIDDITFGKTGRAFMINEVGDIIAHNNLSLVYDKTNYITEAENTKSYLQLATMLVLMRDGNMGTGEYIDNGAKMYAGYAPIGSTGWSIAIAGDSNDFLSGLNNLGSSSTLFTIIFLLLGVCAVFFITDSITKGLSVIVKSISLMADGDLSKEVDEKYKQKKDEIGILANALSKMQSFIREMIDNMKNSSSNIDDQSENLFTISKTVTVATDNVTTAIQDVARGAGEQAEELITMLNSLNNFSDELDRVVHLSNNISQKTSSMSSMAEESNHNMSFLINSSYVIHNSFQDFKGKITELGENIKKVNEIANYINGIAEQTNLLSLNAAIEAARAGVAGRGFTVVAEHVRNLSDQTKKLSININSIINGVCSETEQMIGTSMSLDEKMNHQIEVLNRTIIAFEKMMTAFNNIAPEINGVNSSVYELYGEKNLIIQKIEGVASIAEQVSASSEEIAASAEEMSASMEEITSSAQILTVMTQNMQEQGERFRDV